MNHIRRISIWVIAGLLTAGAVGSTATPSNADSIADQQAQAIAARIEVNGERISALAEQYNGAQLKLQQAQDAIAQATARIASTQRTVDVATALVRERAAAAYREASSGGSTAAFDLSDASKLLRYQKYAEVQQTQDDALLAKLELAKQQLAKQRSDAEAARAEAEAQQRQIGNATASLEAANAQQQQLLGQVQGGLVQLVALEQQRRDTAVLVAAQARYGAGTPNGGSSGGSGPATPASSPAAPASALASTPTTAPAPSPVASAPPAPSPPPVPTPAPASSAADVAIAFARAQLGKPYVYAGVGPNAYDCSGLTMMAYAAAGIAMPHYSGAQYTMFPKVSLGALLPGDLVFWGPGGSDHVGIYIGGGLMIHAPHTGDVVKIAPVYDTPSGAARPW
jgi:cell wall-associated NlpC family hydrolase